MARTVFPFRESRINGKEPGVKPNSMSVFPDELQEAAKAHRFLATYLEAIPIEDKYKVDAVTSPTSGRTFSMEHVKVTVVRLTLSKEPLLAAQFARLCASDAGRAILRKHCYMLPDKP